MNARHGLLFVMMDIPEPHEAELNRWYDEEHLPERRSCEGFLTAKRYVALDGPPRYLATYDLSSVEVLSAPAYRSLMDHLSPWTRRIGGLVTTNLRRVYEERTPPEVAADAAPDAEAAGALLVVLADVRPGGEDELVEWYDGEHLRERLDCPGFVRARRFEAVEGAPRFLALYDLASEDALETDRYRAHQASPTPATRRAQDLMHDTQRKVYRRIA
jgi:hypothetical protein